MWLRIRRDIRLWNRFSCGQRCQWHRWPGWQIRIILTGSRSILQKIRCLNLTLSHSDTADQCWAVSMTPLTLAGWCQWHCGFNYANFVQKSRFHSRISLRIWSHMQKALTRVAGAQMELFDEKNQRSIISWQGPFKSSQSMLNFEVPYFGQQCHWHCPPVVSGVIDTAHHWSAVSLTLPTTSKRCHWHRWPQKINFIAKRL
jgi:hypothetical protein